MNNTEKRNRFVYEHIQECYTNQYFETAHIENVVRMLDNDLTVPFIARYRKKETGGIESDVIRKIQEVYENYKKIEHKINVVIKKVEGTASKELIEHLKAAKTIEEVQELYAPFKTGGKGTLAERARKIGLDNPAHEMLAKPHIAIDLSKYLNKDVEGRGSIKDIEAGIQHVIADIVAKDKSVLDKLKQNLERRNSVFLISKATAKAKELDTKQKYSLYFDHRRSIESLQSHAILAINRGEANKILSVKLEINESARKWIIDWAKGLWIPRNVEDFNSLLLCKAIEDSFKRLIEKSYLRKLRNKLTKRAELEALGVFSNNLKHLLLQAPVKNKVILSIDPGFSNGCKIAVIGKNGELYETAIVFPFKAIKKDEAINILVSLVQKHRIEIIALGNGTACRETESFISELNQQQKFKPMNVSYCIVSECGASVYSVTDKAKSEFAGLDPNLISAVSIGRRLQDPLLELYKIEAKHIGVGMYQHDLDGGLLKGAVEGVVEDCVSFVGVDLNACSAEMLRCVSGLTEKQAQAIIAYRNKNGAFINREELKNVKGIGAVTYRNCAGFVRIIPQKKDFESGESCEGSRKRKIVSNDTKKAKKKSKLENQKEYQHNLLDQTWIHPESYDIALGLLDYIKCSPEMIGSEKLKKILKDQNPDKLSELMNRFKSDEETFKLIVNGLQQPSDYDIRSELQKPSFRTGITKIDQLEVNQKVTGFVRNTTTFGVFVDIGVSVNGLMHQSKIPPNIQLGPGDRIECSIISVEINRNRIGLKYEQKLSGELKLK